MKSQKTHFHRHLFSFMFMTAYNLFLAICMKWNTEMFCADFRSTEGIRELMADNQFPDYPYTFLHGNSMEQYLFDGSSSECIRIIHAHWSLAQQAHCHRPGQCASASYTILDAHLARIHNNNRLIPLSFRMLKQHTTLITLNPRLIVSNENKSNISIIHKRDSLFKTSLCGVNRRKKLNFLDQHRSEQSTLFKNAQNNNRAGRTKKKKPSIQIKTHAKSGKWHAVLAAVAVAITKRCWFSMNPVAWNAGIERYNKPRWSCSMCGSMCILCHFFARDGKRQQQKQQRQLHSAGTENLASGQRTTRTHNPSIHRQSTIWTIFFFPFWTKNQNVFHELK